MEPKPFASLSSSLLARKGQAKPAMRPQGYGGFGQMPGSHEDLGWNDMGYDARPPVAPEPAPFVKPAVLRQREELAEELSAAALPAEPEAPVAEVTPIKLGAERPKKKMVISRVPDANAKAKAAFTLRLDPDRHLRLRLACAVGNRSAQQLVTEALDQFLESIPELESLADRVPARSAG
jgi:hypothetical protein